MSRFGHGFSENVEGETLPSAVENPVWFAQTVLLCIAFYLYVYDCM